MRLRTYDTVHISSVQPDNLKPGDEFDIDDAAGKQLLDLHPGLFAVVQAAGEEKKAPAPENKQAAAPDNKAAAEPIAPVSIVRRGRPPAGR